MSGHIGENITVPAADRQMYENYFAQLRSKDGFVDSSTAREFFSKSELPKNVLADMWSKADRSRDGRLDVEEFCIAMHILRTALHGQKNGRSASSPNIHGISALTPSQNGSGISRIKAEDERSRSGSETTWDFSKFATTLPKTFSDFETMTVFPDLQRFSPSSSSTSGTVSTLRRRKNVQRSKLSDFVARKRLDVVQQKNELEALTKELRDVSSTARDDKARLETLKSSISEKKALERRLVGVVEETLRQEGVLKSSNGLLEKKVKSVKTLIEKEKSHQRSLSQINSVPAFSSAEKAELELAIEEAGRRKTGSVAELKKVEEAVGVATRRNRSQTLSFHEIEVNLKIYLEQNRKLVEEFKSKQRLVQDLQRFSWASVETEASSEHSSKKDGGTDDVDSFREDAKEIEYGIALYSYEARNNDELSFNADDYIELLPSNEATTDWLLGRVFGGDGAVGYVPANYLQFEKNDEYFDEDFTDRAEVSRDEKDESSVLRKKAVRELVDTEERYLADMKTVMEVFYEEVKKSGSCSESELEEIFAVWNPLIVSSEKLCAVFRRYGSEVFDQTGSILQDNLPDAAPYIAFCCNQVKICELIREKTSNSPQFAEVIRQCSQNSRLQGLPLTAAYVKPMQRITRYPLLIKRIIESTTPSFHDYSYLQTALNLAENLCQSVNEKVRDCENRERVEWLGTHVALDSYSDKIKLTPTMASLNTDKHKQADVTSQTNHMGNRVLLYQGSLFKVKGGRELIAFLFNDFLLLTTPPKPLTSTLGNFSFDRRRWTQILPFKIYKKPLLLNNCAVSQLPDPSSFLLTFPAPLSISLPLKATTVQECKAWMRKVEEAVKEYQRLLPNNHRKLTRLYQSSNPPTGVCRVVIQEATDLSLKGEKGKFDVFCKASLREDEGQTTKVVENTDKPRWEHHMNFYIHDLERDILSVTAMQYNAFAPNGFLGRAEVKLSEVVKECRGMNVPLVKRLLLQGVESGEVLVKIAIHMLQPAVLQP
ncbi:hypothetical protein RvY_06665 [Ramazzottius varieornatus]|uniref:Uncharacterized protein n=1 Tax=Ramazzottius varieornatus TaxID=947166 RepID=A0A1D1UZS7_RAMVA|nr:hypothetical protein RvY_06665 [Ramazzottius varieornatus]